VVSAGVDGDDLNIFCPVLLDIAATRLAASISNRFDITRRSPRLAVRDSTPAASVRSIRGKTWRQKPLDAA
jgi:hypothetical protein